MDIRALHDFKEAENCLYCRVMGAETHQRRPQPLPSVEVLDLAVYFVLAYTIRENCFASVPVSYQIMREWGMNEAQLFAAARKNTKAQLPWTFSPMDQILNELQGGEGEVQFPPCMVRSYVLTNAQKFYGAYWMTEHEVLKSIRQKLVEDFYILPSSVHECIILPEAWELSPVSLKTMVREINQTVLSPKERLTDSVYRYCENTDRLELV